MREPAHTSSTLTAEARPPFGSDLERTLERRFIEQGRPRGLLALSFEAKPSASEGLFNLEGYDNPVFFAQTAENERAGVGVARLLVADGPGRFMDLRRRGHELLAAQKALAVMGPEAPPAELVGGFAFAPARGESALWADFGDARFLLSRLSYRRVGERAWLILNVEDRELESEAGRARVANEVRAAEAALLAPCLGEGTEAASFSLVEEAAGSWAELVSGIRGEIAAGRLEKAVAARHVRLRSARLPSLPRVLERLRQEAPECTRFALGAGGKIFVGATPERLIRKQGERFWTDAVAGTVSGDDQERRADLLRSEKDGLEHAIVAREIRAALEPVCRELDVQGPSLYRLRHVAHLRTRFQGTLRQPHHVLELCERLHPTPAVGGAPRAAALAWLSAHERADRGFYAGPFGVFDAAGDGEFVVALRSGLLDEGEAHLFAGAGIVGDSQIESELSETRWKLRSLLSALGAPWA